MERFNYIFIEGQQRSGTNLLLRLLDGHPQLVALPGEYIFWKSIGRMKNGFKQVEGILKNRISDTQYNFLKRHIGLFPRFKEMAEQNRLNTPKGTFSREYGFRFDYRKFESDIYKDLRDGSIGVAELFDITIRNFIANCPLYYINEKVKYIAFKDDTCTYYIPKFLHYFPAGKVIRIVRDPRAIYGSQKTRFIRYSGNWDYGRLVGFVSQTFRNDLLYQKLSRKVSGKNILIVKYEDLLNEGGIWKSELMTFLGIGGHEDVLRRPTYLGVNWEGNSSFDKTDIRSTLYKRKANINLDEVESYYISTRLKKFMKRLNYTDDIKTVNPRIEIALIKLGVRPKIKDAFLRIPFVNDIILRRI